MATPIKYDDLLALWTRQQWRPHYLFTGQEEFLIEQAQDQALRHWLGENADALSVERLDAETQSVEDILQAAQTVPFFGGARVLCIRNAAQFSAKEQEQIAETIASLGPDVHCLFIWGKEWRRDDATKPLVEALGRVGQVVIFWPLFPEQAERWITARAATHYKKILHSQAAHWLIQQSAEGLRLLEQEIAKVATFVGDRKEIELEDLQSSFGYSKASSPYEWVGFIRQQNAASALQVLDQLMTEGEEPVRLLALLSRTLRDWLGAKGSGEAAGMLAMRFRVRRGEENRFAQELARWNEEMLTDAIGQCVEAEQSIKSGKETPEMALTLLTLGLCRREAAYAGR